MSISFLAQRFDSGNTPSEMDTPTKLRFLLLRKEDAEILSQFDASYSHILFEWNTINSINMFNKFV